MLSFINYKNNEYKPRKAYVNGFSLVEVLVAMVIIALSMVMFGYFSTSLRSTAHAKRTTEAAKFSRNYTNALRSQWNTPKDYWDGKIPRLEIPSQFESYTITIQDQDISGANKGTAKEIQSNDSASNFVTAAPNDEDVFKRTFKLVLVDSRNQTYDYETSMVLPATGSTVEEKD